MSEKDLAVHHKVLKQFLVISDDLSTRTKTNSTRAARAREKLLRLSGAQFRELSTDVYDELKRRIDESRGEPDYLLPKSTFHPKRNQARQKLSSLPQTRFKDLVSDISFEIERRGLHAPASVSRTIPNNDDSYSSQGGKPTNPGFQNESRNIDTSNQNVDKSISSNHDNSRDKFNEIDAEADANSTKPSMSSDLINQNIGVQPKTVVPTKANLMWSSDEEGEDDQPDINQLDILEDENRHANRDMGETREIQGDNKLDSSGSDTDRIIVDLRNKLSTIVSEKENLEEKYRSLQSDYEYSATQNKTLSDEMDQLSEEKNNWLKSKSDYDRQLNDFQSTSNSRSLESHNQLLKDFENMKAANASLRLENHSLKSASPKETATSPQQSLNRELLSPRGTLSRGIAMPSNQSNSLNSFENPVNGSGATKTNMETFIERLSNIDSAPIKKSVDTDNDNVATWQKRYEDLRSDRLSHSLPTSVLSDDKLQAFVSTSGLVSIKLVSELHTLIECFILSLNDLKVDTDLLFDRISRISLLGNQIANQGDNQNLNINENSVCLREAVSYALTATRYYAIYSDILPKIVLERSLGEICFTVCDLISVSKLNENSTSSRNVNPTPSPIPASLQKSRNISNSTQGDDDLNSAVRPLRMANKLRETQSQNKDIENINSKSYEGDALPVRRGLLPNEQMPNAKELDNSPTKNINALASRFEPNTTIAQEEDSKSPIRKQDKSNLTNSNTSRGMNSNNTTPTKKSSILDRVKQFESPVENKPINNSSYRSPNELVHSKSGKSVDYDLENQSEGNSFLVSRSSLEIRKHKQEARELNNTGFNGKHENILPEELGGKESNEESNSSKTGMATAAALAATAGAGTAVAATKGKGLFQSIRERIVSGTDKENESDDNRKTEDDINTNDRELSNNGELLSKDSVSDVELNSGIKPLKNKSSLENKSYESADGNIGDMKSQENKASVANMQHNVNMVGIEKPNNKLMEEAPQKSKGVNFVNGLNDSQNRNTKDSINNSDSEDYEDESDEDPEEVEARQRQEHRKSMAAATFNIDLFDIDDPDNTLTQVLLYLEHQTVQVISTIQSLLSAIKKPSVTRGDLSNKSKAIAEVISQMTEATNTSMNQTRNAQLKEHGNWVVKSLEDCNHRMNILSKPNSDKNDLDFADKNFKQRLAGISFDIAKCTKELVKTVEEASLKEDIENLNARLSRSDDLT